MRLSKPTQTLLNSIKDDDVLVVWGQDTFSNELEKWCSEKALEIRSHLKKSPWKAIDGAIEIWEKYLINQEFCNDSSTSFSILKRAAWEWSTASFEKIFYYYPDIKYCVAYVDNGVLDFEHSQPTKDQIFKVIEALKAIRLGKPSTFSKEEKEQIKNKFRKNCNDQNQQETYQRYFEEGCKKTPNFQ